MDIQNVNEKSFKKYGRLLEGYDVSRLLKEMEHMPLPADDVIYVPSVEELEVLAVAECFRERAFGGLPIQIGYCNGNNHKLNALEYHRSSEVNIAVTDMILLVGRQQDIEEDYTYDTSKVEAYLVPAGTTVELYATTLHYAPCSVGSRFSSVVVLPRGTNTELCKAPSKEGEEKLMTARNKWLIAHKDACIDGAFEGLKGMNINV